MLGGSLLRYPVIYKLLRGAEDEDPVMGPGVTRGMSFNLLGPQFLSLCWIIKGVYRVGGRCFLGSVAHPWICVAVAH